MVSSGLFWLISISKICNKFSKLALEGQCDAMTGQAVSRRIDLITDNIFIFVRLRQRLLWLYIKKAKRLFTCRFVTTREILHEVLP